MKTLKIATVIPDSNPPYKRTFNLFTSFAAELGYVNLINFKI